MIRLKIQVLPDIINVLVLLSAFSAGNSYVYCASRSLFGLALDGKAPKIFARTNRSGVPIYSVLLVLLIGLLAFLSVSSGSQKVLTWFISLITASQLINFSVMCATFLFWMRALKAQGIPRETLPYRAWFQPYAAVYGLFWTFIMTFVGGYTVFLPTFWTVEDFIFSYFMVGLFPVLFIAWTLIKKAKLRKPEEVDLKGEVEDIEEVRELRKRAPRDIHADASPVHPKLRGGSLQECPGQVLQHHFRRMSARGKTRRYRTYDL
jgi:amino acid transporter